MEGLAKSTAALHSLLAGKAAGGVAAATTTTGQATAIIMAAERVLEAAKPPEVVDFEDDEITAMAEYRWMMAALRRLLCAWQCLSLVSRSVCVSALSGHA
jgi:RecA/RadA recombinase